MSQSFFDTLSAREKRLARDKTDALTGMHIVLGEAGCQVLGGDLDVGQHL